MKHARSLRDKLIIALLALAAAYLVLFAILAAKVHFSPHYKLYVPDTEPLGAPILSMAQVITTHTADGLWLNAWFVPPPDPDGKVILFFHGNAGNIENRAIYKAPVLLLHRYGIFLCEYRGYGGNRGKPGERGLYTDARAALDWLNRHGYPNSRLVYYGESVGSAVAIELALEKPPDLMVLEGAFSSLADLGKVEFPWLPFDFLIEDRLDNIDKIGKLHVPLVIVHGNQDVLVPIASDKKLFAAANPPKDFIEVDGAGHNDTYYHNAGEDIANWLDRQVRKEKQR